MVASNDKDKGPNKKPPGDYVKDKRSKDVIKPPNDKKDKKGK